jgi:hypothetical protein
MENPMFGECFTATLAAGERHVRLEVLYTQAGWNARVIETDGNTQVECEMVDSLDSGKQRAEEIAQSYLGDKDLLLPSAKWEKKQ